MVKMATLVVQDQLDRLEQPDPLELQVTLVLKG